MTRIVSIVGLLLSLAILVATIWYFVSPLFLNQTVNEALPFDLPIPAIVIETPGTEPTPQFPDDDEIGVIMPPAPHITEEVSTEGTSGEITTTEALPTEAVTATITETTGITDTTETTGTEEISTEPSAPLVATVVATKGAAAPSNTPSILGQGQFVDGDSFHKGSGLATLYTTPDGGHLLRFDDFTATNGPDLHVLLSPNAAPTDHASLGEYLDLGALKGNIGDQNYTLPADFDPTRYKSVIIYCLPFQVIFATAVLE